MNYGRRYGETWRRDAVDRAGAVKERTETLIPGYIHRGNGATRFFGLNDFDFDYARRNEINRVPFVLLLTGHRRGDPICLLSFRLSLARSVCVCV